MLSASGYLPIKRNVFVNNCLYLRVLGFLEKEIKKDEIPMLDTGDNPDAPAPREMIDLEVITSVSQQVLNH